MPIALLKLPFLIQQSICRELNHSQLTTMSFCSLMMRRLIEFLHLKVPKVHYKKLDMGFRCDLGFDEEVKKVLVIRERSKWLRKDTQKINLGGVKIQVRFSSKHDERGNTYYIIDVPRIDGTIERSVQKHINSLFRYSGTSSVKIEQTSCLTRLPRFRNVTDSLIRGERIDVKVLERYFTKNPNHYSANIQAVVDSEIPEDSKIWNIGRLSIRNQTSVGTCLRRFSGQHLHLRNVHSDASDVAFLLDEWVSNRAFRQLKTLFIRWKSSHWPAYYEIMDRLELTRRKRVERATRLAYNTEIIHMKSSHLKVGEEDVYIIERIDGKEAFLYCCPDVVWLFVHDEPK